MVKLTIMGKRTMLLFLAIATIWLTLPPAKNSTYARILYQTDTSPLDSTSPLNIEQRNNQGVPATGSTQNESPLNRATTQEDAQQQNTPEATDRLLPELPALTATVTAAPMLTATTTLTATESQVDVTLTDVPPTLTPTAVLTVTETATQVSTPTETPTEQPTEVPTEAPTIDVEPTRENAYTPEDDIPQVNSNEGMMGFEEMKVNQTVTNSAVGSDPFGSLFSLESMILALLCMIFISINGLGVVALVVTILYIRSRRDQPYL